MNNVKATQTGNGNLGVDKGKLRIAVTSEITSYPVADATISISYTGVPEILWKNYRQTLPDRQKKLNWQHRRLNTA